MLPTLNILGAGRVGRTLAHLWHTHRQFRIQGVACRSPERAREAVAFIGAGTAFDAQNLPPADVWMLAVPDASIADVAHSLAARAPSPAAGAVPVVFHCAGASGSELLQPLTDLGWRSASAHCILSFARTDTAVAQFPGTVCALEGEIHACTQLRHAFEAIGAQCFALRREDKMLYHAAAVFATNFVPVLQSVAEDAWTASGVPPHLLPHLRQTLLHNAVRNITGLGPAGALTGPAARGDTGHIARQSAVVHQWNADAGTAYDALSVLALELARRASGMP